MVQFTNLSPYTAKVEFPSGNSDCWLNDGAQDGRVEEYFGYYRNSAVSAEGYRDFLDAYRDSTGIQDFNRVARYTMDNTSVRLTPAVVGEKAGTALFIGEPSASLFGGCKLATSSRGFNIALLDNNGAILSRQYYVLQDPPDSQWTLSRMRAADPKAKEATIMLGAGGHGDALEIAITAGITAITLVSLGTATAELLAARAAVQAVLAEEAAFAAVVARVFQTTGGEVIMDSVYRRMFTYALEGGARIVGTAAEIGVANYVRGTASSIVTRLLYTALAGGVVVVYQSNNGPDPISLPRGATINDGGVALDFSKPSLIVNAALPDDRSICIYQTGTLGITECRLVGISLTIMPDGSLAFMPLPSVGSGD